MSSPSNACGETRISHTETKTQEEKRFSDQLEKGEDSFLRMDGDPIMDDIIELHKGRPIKLQVKVLVPVHDHPNFNFVGKLLGPKGNSLKRLQEATQTRMAILGKGSMRNKEKEQELRNMGDPKHSHLRQNLHVEISTFAPAAEAYARIAHALTEVKRFLVPDYYDEIRQHQLRELAILNDDRKYGHSGGSDIDNGAESSSPISSPTSRTPPPPPPEPLQILPPATSTHLHSPHTPIIHLSNSNGGNGRIPRIQYPSYRPTPSILTPTYRRIPLNLDADPPTIVIPDHDDAGYHEAFPEEFYNPLYENELPAISSVAKDAAEFVGPITRPHDRHYEHSFYGESWPPSSSCTRRRLKAFSMSTAPPTSYRSKPYALPPCHLVQ